MSVYGWILVVLITLATISAARDVGKPAAPARAITPWFFASYCVIAGIVLVLVVLADRS